MLSHASYIILYFKQTGGKIWPIFFSFCKHDILIDIWLIIRKWHSEMRANTLHLYLCPPCLLKAHARATTCPVALLATGTQSMEKISYPNMVDSCWHSSCRQERDKYNFGIVVISNTWSKNERSKADPLQQWCLEEWLTAFFPQPDQSVQM